MVTSIPVILNVRPTYCRISEESSTSKTCIACTPSCQTNSGRSENSPLAGAFPQIHASRLKIEAHRARFAATHVLLIHKDSHFPEALLQSEIVTFPDFKMSRIGHHAGSSRDAAPGTAL